MVTTASESFFKSLVPSVALLSLENFALDISSANNSKVTYSGYALLDVSVPSLVSSAITEPVLIVPDTSYSTTVPLIVGTNVIRHFQETSNNNPESVQFVGSKPFLLFPFLSQFL